MNLENPTNSGTGIPTGVAGPGAGPVTGAERLTSIDTLRGVAVLGILVMNIYGFAMPFAAYQDPLAMGGLEWYNLGTWFFTHIFFDQKFMTIFSILYGAGLVMMMNRAASRGAPYTANWYRRSLWLMVIGALHGYLIWFGDILFHYALMGMLIFPFRKLAPKTLIVVACFLLSVGVLMNVAGGTYMQDLKDRAGAIAELADSGDNLDETQKATLAEWDEMSAFVKPPAEQVAEDKAAYTGSWTDAFRHRAPLVRMMQTQATIGFIVWRVGGLMLLGMALMKLGILSGRRSDGFYRKMLVIGYGAGLPVMLFSAWQLGAHRWDLMWMLRFGGIPNYVGSLFVAFGHMALVMLIVRRGVLSALMRRFAAVGRMAFTNYLMHSVVMTTIFYGYGLGLYGGVPRLLQMGFVAGMLAFQLWFSPIWLDRMRFGPAEWLWRSLTYWRLQRMRA